MQIYSLEAIDWSSDCIWDIWLRGIFNSKEKIDEDLVAFQNTKDTLRFRVLEFDVDKDAINKGWIIIVGEGRYEWKDAAPDEMQLMGRGSFEER